MTSNWSDCEIGQDIGTSRDHGDCATFTFPDGSALTITPYAVGPDDLGTHWEYTIEGNGREWDSIECDNGMIGQRAHSYKEALHMAITGNFEAGMNAATFWEQYD